MTQDVMQTNLHNCDLDVISSNSEIHLTFIHHLASIQAHTFSLFVISFEIR